MWNRPSNLCIMVHIIYTWMEWVTFQRVHLCIVELKFYTFADVNTSTPCSSREGGMRRTRSELTLHVHTEGLFHYYYVMYMYIHDLSLYLSSRIFISQRDSDMSVHICGVPRIPQVPLHRHCGQSPNGGHSRLVFASFEKRIYYYAL